jgi:hypothetical protein
MRRYSDEDERTIRVGRLANEWMRSGLLNPAQYARLAPGLHVGLRRTNVFLRVALFGFGLLIIAAAVGLVMVTGHVRDAAAAAVVCVIGAAACAGAAEFLVARFRLYRFGVEEACAAGAVVLLASAGGMATDSWAGNRQFLVAAIVGAAAAFAVYRRFGYLYAALAAMACAALAPFAVGGSAIVHHVLAAGILIGCVVVARSKFRQHGDEFPGDQYAALETAGVLGLYSILNFQLLWDGRGSIAASFYWFTYLMIWVIPVAGLIDAARERKRWLLDASLAMALATLATNKPYLGLAHREWDPALLGVLLIGAALAMRRWLGSGEAGTRRGVTASRILRAEKDRVALVGIASGFQDAPASTYPAGPTDPFAGGGGRAGGGGAEGSF